jgi:tight adherence protein B
MNKAFPVIAVVAVTIGLLTESAIAGLMFLGYGTAALLALRRRQVSLARRKDRKQSLEILASAAADLRAGASASTVSVPDRELAGFVQAAQRLSDRTGAGLAQLLEGIETQQRTLSRLDNATHAETAGVRLTVILLLCLPLGAILAGYPLGVQPLGMLLHTEIGALCAAIAMALQLTGLAWSVRLQRSRKPTSHDQLAFAADLIAASLQAGSPVARAVLTAGEIIRDAETGLLPITPLAQSLSPNRSLLPTSAPRKSSFSRRSPLAALSRRKSTNAIGGRMTGESVTGMSDRKPGSFARRNLSSRTVSRRERGQHEDVRRQRTKLGERLLRVGYSLSWGVAPAYAWEQLADTSGQPTRHCLITTLRSPPEDDAAVARIVAAAKRCNDSGAALAGALTRCADELRADAAHERNARAKRAGVLLVLPLGLCFLPAFLLAGLVPVVLAVFVQVL